MTELRRGASVATGSTLPCPECRGMGFFTLQPANPGPRSRVECPICRGTAVCASPDDHDPKSTWSIR